MMIGLRSTGSLVHQGQAVLSAACWPDARPHVPVARRRTQCGTLRTNGAENAAAGQPDRSEPKTCEKCGLGPDVRPVDPGCWVRHAGVEKRNEDVAKTRAWLPPEAMPFVYFYWFIRTDR